MSQFYEKSMWCGLNVMWGGCALVRIKEGTHIFKTNDIDSVVEIWYFTHLKKLSL